MTDGEETIIFCGSYEAFETAQAALTALAPRLHHVGERLGGAATLTNAQIADMMHLYVGVLQGTVFCQAAGVPVKTFLKTMLLDHLPAETNLSDLAEIVHAAENRAFDDEVGATLEAWRGGLRQVMAQSWAAGLDMSTLESLDALMDRAEDLGHGCHDLEGVIDAIQPRDRD